MIPVKEIVNCTDCSRYIRIGYDAVEVEQLNKNYNTAYNCKDCYKPNKSYHGTNTIFLDTKVRNRFDNYMDWYNIEL